MNGLQINSITGAGMAAASTTTAALVRKHQGLNLGSSDRLTKARVKQDATTQDPASSAGQITSADFLTLLVSELKNQDPTQPTDPNAYISQLVGVNSLQQLISINQELTPTS